MAHAESSKGSIQRGNTLPNGDIYVGNFDGLVPHGLGKYMWTDGALYDGEWDKSKMTGRGLIQWPSGAYYEGDFRGGFIDGTGTFKGVDGSVYNDGFGEYTWADGNTYTGNWKSGKMNGRGVMQWVNSDTLDCNWLDGLAHGKGYCKYPSGACYIGTWDRGLKDGHDISSKSFSADESLQDNEVDKDLVFEREYVQGVLIMEQPKNEDSRMLDSGITQENTWQKQARGPMETIYKGHRSYYLMLNLQLGIRYTVGKITPVPLREVRSNDFGPRARIKMYFPYTVEDASKYYNHVKAYDNTLITKFFGVHRITLKAGRKVRFVVMGNMFCTELRIHRKYDLKGSTQDSCFSPKSGGY
ncbi:hypothetical protein GUJ93_ZPchr0003g17181 [Zizania palustris]|uniref:1-phosphatidylinositol-4-phosphate 5-kinase n=1 Tax=Zizania palustris TaxID=103762 RepID=A0A8J5VJK3_ZIZPA|nr:hypothetical protein GUJ93_ZPchr0003g17181 [Zizania palustris]